MIRNFSRIVTLALLTLSGQGGLTAAIVTYEFGSGGQSAVDLIGLESGTTQVAGVTMTASASPADAVFHYTGSSGFGINSPLGDSPHDVTTHFDSVDGIESMTFSFDSAGYLTNMKFNSFSGGTTDDQVSVSISGGKSMTFTDSDLGSDNAYDFDVTWAFSAGTMITLAYANGNGFGLDSIQINTFSAVPEPEHYAMFSGLALVGFAAWRKRRLSKA